MEDAVRFRGLDLNLLVALDCLLTERNVSRAADKLCLSQSAVSGALLRLREYFGDELLTQLGRSMVLTPRAAELMPAVRNILMQVEGTVLKRPEFDAANARREIRIIASDYVTIAALADALRPIKAKAPDLRFNIVPPADAPRERLERGEVEFLIMPDLYLSSDHPSLPLFSDDYRAIVWNGNNAIGEEPLSLETFLSMRHVAVSYTQFGFTFEGAFLEQFGKERQVEVTTSSYSAVPFLIVGTDRIALMQRRLAQSYAAMMPLRVLRAPAEIPEIHEALQWHIYNDNDECLRWLRRQLVDHIVGRMEAPAKDSPAHSAR
jgi:DNA-binding transcriptional LysR family regulator